MKSLTFDEFQNRLRVVSRARRIFIPNLTRNISNAFALYQEILEEDDRLLSLEIANNTGGFAPSILDDFPRPPCPKCKTPLRLSILTD